MRYNPCKVKVNIRKPAKLSNVKKFMSFSSFQIFSSI